EVLLDAQLPAGAAEPVVVGVLDRLEPHPGPHRDAEPLPVEPPEVGRDLLNRRAGRLAVLQRPSDPDRHRQPRHPPPIPEPTTEQPPADGLPDPPEPAANRPEDRAATAADRAASAAEPAAAIVGVAGAAGARVESGERAAQGSAGPADGLIE